MQFLRRRPSVKDNKYPIVINQSSVRASGEIYRYHEFNTFNVRWFIAIAICGHDRPVDATDNGEFQDGFIINANEERKEQEDRRE